jgi:hypothetical protein
MEVEETTDPVMTREEAEAAVEQACAVLLEAGLRPTRVLVPIGVYRALGEHVLELLTGRAIGLRRPEGAHLVKLTVTSTNPTGRYVVAYAE